MKLFLKSFLIFLSPIIFIGILGEKLLRDIPNDYSYKKEYLDMHSNQIETLFLGNSHVYFGLNPKYIKNNSFNSSQVSQSLDFDLMILKKYKNNWNSLKFIVLPVDYFSLYSNLENSIESWRIKNYNIYFDFKTSDNFFEHSEIVGNKMKVNYDKLHKFYLQNLSIIKCSNLGFGLDYKSKNKQDLLLTGIEAVKRHTVGNENLFNYNRAILREIIELAKVNNTKVILVTSPTYKSYFENLDYKQLNQTLKEINNFEHSFCNVKYFNFLRDLSFKKEDFYDADHLNEIGAKKWTLKIDSIISSESLKRDFKEN